MKTSADARPTCKEVYVQAFEASLSLKRAQLSLIKRKVRQLHDAEKHADNALATAAAKLQQLNDANDDSSQSLTPESDVAWEDLARSLKAVVSRFS